MNDSQPNYREPPSPPSIRASWESERQSVYLYRRLVDVETDEGKRRLFQALSEEADAQSKVWVRKLESLGETAPASFVPGLRLRLVGALLRLLGPRPVLPILAAMKVRGLSLYWAPPVGHAMPPSPREERRRHRGADTGGSLRAAVFGVNDGLVSNTSLILGVAGASGDSQVVLLSGVAGLLAGAFSMAAGEYVSVRSQRELYEHQIGLEREELELYPEQEAEEMALIYHARGIPLEEARQLAKSLIEVPDHALDTLAREELGLNPDDLGSPWGAATSSFASFAAGGALPLVPFLFQPGSTAVILVAGLSAVGLFSVGALLSLFTGRHFLWSGLRMVAIGLLAGMTTYAIGSWLGVTLL